VSSRSDKFDGAVTWKGFSEKVEYEFTGGGPFIHRRVLFASKIPWPVQCLTKHNSGEDGDKSYCRLSGSSLADPNPVGTLADTTTAGCLRRIFTEHTVRGLVHGGTQPKHLVILEDRVFSYSGSANGSRRKKKFWNDFGGKGKPKTMKYKLDRRTGDVTADPEDSSVYQHIYLVDVFQYGLAGLDLDIPSPERLMSPPMSSAGARGKSSQMDGQPRPKKVKSDSASSIDSDMVDVGKLSMSDANSVTGVEGIAGALREMESTSVVARCFSTIKIYWNKPK
jgi:hypothetical protein